MKHQKGHRFAGEVKRPTAALKAAAEIGVLHHGEAAGAGKRAILIVSFGTKSKDVREASILPVQQAIAKAFPDVHVELCFTSHIIIERILEREGRTYPTPEEALERLLTEGYDEVAFVPLHFIPGMEYDYIRAVYQSYKEKFRRASLSVPLIYWQGQENQRDDAREIIPAMLAPLGTLEEKEAVLFMAHGTMHYANAMYYYLQVRAADMVGGQMFFYTVEGTPTIEDIVLRLKEKSFQRVTLVPFMLTAGEHVQNDMAGEEDSHKTVLEAAGFEVRAYLHGLGENEAIQQQFVKRAREAVEALE